MDVYRYGLIAVILIMSHLSSNDHNTSDNSSHLSTNHFFIAYIGTH